MTTVGRVLAMALMLVGIGFIAILIGAIAGRFLSAQIEEIEEEIRDEVEELRAMSSRNYGRHRAASHTRAPVRRPAQLTG